MLQASREIPLQQKVTHIFAVDIFLSRPPLHHHVAAQPAHALFFLSAADAEKLVEGEEGDVGDGGEAEDLELLIFLGFGGREVARV